MTRGRELTRPTKNLAEIFWHIRTERDSAVRRSWQRRARIQLKMRADLTDAERHEIAAVWSRLDCDRFDSPALRKILQTVAHEGQRAPARSAMRAAFDADGRRRSVGRPDRTAHGARGIERGEAANDATARRDDFV